VGDGLVALAGLALTTAAEAQAEASKWPQIPASEADRAKLLNGELLRKLR
jgi:hypothetical protein